MRARAMAAPGVLPAAHRRPTHAAAGAGRSSNDDRSIGSTDTDTEGALAWTSGRGARDSFASAGASEAGPRRSGARDGYSSSGSGGTGTPRRFRQGLALFSTVLGGAQKQRHRLSSAAEEVSEESSRDDTVTGGNAVEALAKSRALSENSGTSLPPGGAVALDSGGTAPAPVPAPASASAGTHSSGGTGVGSTSGGPVASGSARSAPAAHGVLWIEFTVTDTGAGVPPEKQALLFRPFTQFSSSVAAKNAGTGLGLVITKARATRVAIPLRKRLGCLQSSVSHS